MSNEIENDNHMAAHFGAPFRWTNSWIKCIWCCLIWFTYRCSVCINGEWGYDGDTFCFFLLFSLRSIMCLHTFYLIIMFFLVNGFRIRKWKYSIAEDDLINAHSRHSKSQTGGEHTDLAEESRCSGVFFFPAKFHAATVCHKHWSNSSSWLQEERMTPIELNARQWNRYIRFLVDINRTNRIMYEFQLFRFLFLGSFSVLSCIHFCLYLEFITNCAHLSQQHEFGRMTSLF